MKKSTIIPLISALGLIVLFYLIYTNQTLVFKSFEVKMEKTDAFTGTTSKGVTYSNLNCVLNGNCILTFWGWIKVATYFVFLPLAVFTFLKRRYRKKEQMQNPAE